MKNLKTITFREVLRSYLFICVILLLITATGYLSSIHYMKKEVKHSAELKTKELITQVKNKIMQTYKVCDILAGTQELKALIDIGDIHTPEQIQKTMDLRLLMSKMNLQDDLYQNLHVYFLSSKSMVSSSTQVRSGEQDLAFFCREYGIEKDEFDRLMSMKEGKIYQIFDNNLVWFLRPVYGEGEIPEAVIAAEYTGTALVDYTEEENIVLIHTEEPKNILCSGKITEEEQKKFINDVRNGQYRSDDFREVVVHRKWYVSLGIDMNLFNWKLYTVLPNNLFWSELWRFVVVLLVEIAVLAAASVLASWYASKRTFVPITNLMKDNKKLTKKVQNRGRLLEHMELVRYLEGVTDVFPYGAVEQINTDGRESYLMAVVTLGEERRKILGEDGREIRTEENLEQFVLENILGEQVFLQYPGFVMAVGSQYVILVHSTGQNGCEKHLQELFRETEQFFEETFKVSMCVMMGREECGYERMKEVYDSLTEGIRYLDFWNSRGERKSGIYIYGEMIEGDEQVNFSEYMNGSRKLMNCLESEDFRGAYRELDLLYKKTFPRNQKYLKYNIYRMYGLIGILIATLDVYSEEDEQDSNRILQYEERLFRIQSIHDLMTESREIFEQIIQYREKQARETGTERVTEMQQYIEEHYPDPELNVSRLADVFGISVPHLSRSFKNQTGMGVLEYIHRVKIRYSKEMLKNDASIKNAAWSTGYTDAQSFTRAFKRYEGITPSQYKDLISKNEV